MMAIGRDNLETWAFHTKDGWPVVFEIERGSQSEASTGKYDRASCAKLTHSNGLESYLYWNEFDDHLKLASISLQPERRGSGVALVTIVELVVQEAAKAGKGFHSDYSVSSEALKLYTKLEQLGYLVEYATDNEVVGVPFVPRDDHDFWRQSGSVQLIAQDNRPVARVLAPGATKSQTKAPTYVMNLLQPQNNKVRSEPLPAPLKPYGEFNTIITSSITPDTISDITLDTMASYVRTQQLTSSSMVRSEGMTEWTSASKVSELSSLLEPPKSSMLMQPGAMGLLMLDGTTEQIKAGLLEYTGQSMPSHTSDTEMNDSFSL